MLKIKQINHGIFKTVATFAIVFALSACGGDSSPLSRPESAAGTLTSTTSATFAGDYGDAISAYGSGADSEAATTAQSTSNGFGDALNSQQFRSFLQQSRLSSRALRGEYNESDNSFKAQQDFSSCEPAVTAGDVDVDADSDSIPANVTYGFECAASSDETGFDFSASGTLSMVDKDDDDAFGGFTLLMSDYGVSASGEYEGASFSLSFLSDANMDFTKGTTSYNGVFDFAATLVAEASGSGESVNLEMLIGNYLDVTVTPDDMDDVENSDGSATIAGYFSFQLDGSASAGFTDEAIGAESFVLAIASSGLMYDSSCDDDDAFSAGSITYTDGSGNVLTETFADCTSTWDLDDEEITPALN